MISNFILLAAGGGTLGSYEQIIGASVIILLSYVFDQVAKQFKIPSVILLIGLGMVITWAGTKFLDIKVGDSIIPVLNILGTIGIILIVLEAALDLKLRKEKKSLIFRAFIIAFAVLLLTVFGVAMVLVYFLSIDLLPAIVYATPLSVMSSAIVIPSVGSLVEDKKEFMIYEATFSDILGIILFYFLIGLNPEEMSVQGALVDELIRILITVVISVVVSFGMVYFISGITKKANFFTIFAMLALFYALGKKFHLSSLIIILIFGLILYNDEIFFRGKLKRLVSSEHKKIINDFKLLTHQTAFLVRTFFFVAFGMIISVSALKDPQVLIISGIILLVIYAIRYAHLKLVQYHSIVPELFIAPRGLITVLLFFQIPDEYKLTSFNDGIMSVVIIVTSLIMMFALIFSRSDDYRIIEDISTHNDSALLGYGRDVDN